VHRLLALLAAAFTAGCSVFGIRSGYEQPRCDVLDRVGDDVEIRRYGARLVAETTVEAADEETARTAAFRILAAYIFGENRAEEKVAMTTPVVVEPAGQTLAMTAPVETSTAGPGRWSMRFFLPSDLTVETAPTPTDARVRVTQVPGETLAVLRFSGGTRAAAVADRQAELLRRLAVSPWRAHGTPVTFFYDPPWTLPFLRRNEAAVAVRRAPANP
jgi:hypothetical protein